jgi:hypothetical protein
MHPILALPACELTSDYGDLVRYSTLVVLGTLGRDFRLLSRYTYCEVGSIPLADIDRYEGCVSEISSCDCSNRSNDWLGSA